jgi:putative ABC transport system permease protein
MVMLSKEFMRWAILANLVAWAVSWLAVNLWLQNFAYGSSVEWWVFVLAGAMCLGIALITISFRTIRSATANPADALRDE